MKKIKEKNSKQFLIWCALTYHYVHDSPSEKTFFLVLFFSLFTYKVKREQRKKGENTKLSTRVMRRSYDFVNG